MSSTAAINILSCLCHFLQVTRLEDVPKNEELLIEKVVCMKLEIHTYYIFIASEFAIITREMIQPLETLLRTCFARSTWFYYEKKVRQTMPC